jgi:hypothetical protein
MTYEKAEDAEADSMIGIALTDVNGWKTGVGFSTGVYRFSKLNTSSPFSLAVESLTDTSKRVTGFNIGFCKQYAAKPALLLKQPNDQWYAYPWYRGAPRFRFGIVPGEFSGSPTLDTTLTFSKFQINGLNNFDNFGDLASLQTISGNQKVVMNYEFHGSLHGLLTLALPLRDPAKNGQAVLTLNFNSGGENTSHPLFQPLSVPVCASKEVNPVYNIPFYYNIDLDQGAYLDTVSIQIYGIGGGSFSADLDMLCIADAGFYTPTGASFGN